jgi:hypothetical protein
MIEIDSPLTFGYLCPISSRRMYDMNEHDKRLYEAKAAVLKALAHPTRLWMAEQVASLIKPL